MPSLCPAGTRRRQRLVVIRLLVSLLLLPPLGACAASAESPTAAVSPAGPSPSASPDDWPMYGQNLQRTSRNPAEQRLTAASLARLAPRWQADLGSGPLPPSGTPAVANGVVYVGSSVTSGDNFFALDASSGHTLWTASVGPPIPGTVGVGASPAVADGMVVAGGADAAYYGLDAASGTVRWRHALDVGPSGFAWASPLVTGGRAFVGVSSAADDPSVAGEVRALDLATGALLAAASFVPAGLAGAGIWNSPALGPGGRALFVVTGEDFAGYDGPYNRAMVVLDPDSLAILQADKEGATGLDLDFGSTPVVFSDASGRTLVGANHKNGIFYAYDADHVAGGPVWSRATGLSTGLMPGYDPSLGPGGTLFVVGDNGLLFGLDPASGNDRWPPVAFGIAHGNMAIANGLVLLSVDGIVIVVDGASGGVLRRLVPAGGFGPTYSGLAVAGGFVYWLSGSRLSAWSVQ